MAVTAGLALALVALVACTPGTSQPARTASPQVTAAGSGASPALDGASLLASRCVTCHSVSRVERTHGTAAEWDQLVSDMISRGARLTGAEKAVLVDYLAKTYGP